MDGERDLARDLNRSRRIRRMRTVVMTMGDLVATNRRGMTSIMITFTYRQDRQFRTGHLRQCNAAIAKYCRRRGVQPCGVWVMELTKKGRPHYHLLLFVPGLFRLPKPDEQGWWPHGTTRIERARRGVAYLSKYASKGSDAAAVYTIPCHARLFGAFGLNLAERHIVTFARRPRWLRRLTTPMDVVHRVTGVGYVCEGTGEVWQSPYTVEFRFNAATQCVELVLTETIAAAASAEGASSRGSPHSPSWREPTRWQERQGWMRTCLAELLVRQPLDVSTPRRSDTEPAAVAHSDGT